MYDLDLLTSIQTTNKSVFNLNKGWPIAFLKDTFHYVKIQREKSQQIIMFERTYERKSEKSVNGNGYNDDKMLKSPLISNKKLWMTADLITNWFNVCLIPEIQ